MVNSVVICFWWNDYNLHHAVQRIITKGQYSLDSNYVDLYTPSIAKHSIKDLSERRFRLLIGDSFQPYVTNHEHKYCDSHATVRYSVLALTRNGGRQPCLAMVYPTYKIKKASTKLAFNYLFLK